MTRPIEGNAVRLLCTGLLLLGCASAHAELCGGPLENNNFQRPIDFRDRTKEAAALNIVERIHFTSDVEALVKGATAPLPMDIDYTLRQIPNHYRALSAMARWDLQHPRRADAKYYTVECYFERAFAFHPDDPNPYFIYAVYLHRHKSYDAAVKEYTQAEMLGLNSPELYYNLGLLYLDMKDLRQAKEYADKAYGEGYPLPGLKNRLERAGVH
jgi:tetratricopeptide (TPR) repeat protein